MRNLTRCLLWAFVFTVPWDNFPLPLVGSVSRVFGLAVVAAAVMTTALHGRFRKPDAVLGFAMAFSAFGILSLLWTISYGNTVIQAVTLAQMVGSVWVIREFVRTREQLEPLLAAICLGLFVPLVGLLNNFRLGATINPYESRYTGSGINADLVGLYLVLGLPIAWHLLIHRRGIIRVAALIYFVAAPVGLLLTGTRGAFLAGIAACAIVPLSLPRLSLRSYALGGVILILVTISTAMVVPRANWQRITGIASEINSGGNMSGRTMIWNAALQAFPQRPLLGVGVGGFGAAIAQNVHDTRMANAHNMFLGLLVEDGIVGLSLFAGIVGACLWTVVHSPPPYRALWGVLTLTLLVAGISLSPEGVKFTWVLIGLIAAQSGLKDAAGDVSPMKQPSRTATESLRPVSI